MGIFKKKTVKPIPEECRGMEIKINPIVFSPAQARKLSDFITATLVR